MRHPIQLPSCLHPGNNARQPEHLTSFVFVILSPDRCVQESIYCETHTHKSVQTKAQRVNKAIKSNQMILHCHDEYMYERRWKAVIPVLDFVTYCN
jgi:hypothetical protein